MYKVENEDPKIIARMRIKSEDTLKENNTKPMLNVDILEKKYFNLLCFLNIDTVNTFKKLEAIYRFVDAYLSKSGKISKAICQKGCAHCCMIDVDVSRIEALYIAHKTGYTAVQRKERIEKNYHDKKEYCPFLNKDTATCTIYAYRPLSCRTFFAFDHYSYCESMESHEIMIGHKDKNLIPLFVYMFKDLSELENADIREWFKEFTDIPYDGVYDKNIKF